MQPLYMLLVWYTEARLLTCNYLIYELLCSPLRFKFLNFLGVYFYFIKLIIFYTFQRLRLDGHWLKFNITVFKYKITAIP